MSPRFRKQPRRTLACQELSDAYMDFILSREAMPCTPATLDFYHNTAHRFLLWGETQGIACPNQITARYIRQYIAELKEKGRQDTTLNAHGRAIRTLMNFWLREKYIPEAVTFDVPKLSRKRLPILRPAQLLTILQACNVRDKAIVLLMADSGIRRSETCTLNWGDINLENGLVRIKQGKGKKDRSVVVGATTRRSLLKYKRTIPHIIDETPLFLSRTGYRLTGTGLLIVYRRLTKQTGIHVTPHAMRRTFVVLSLRAGMDAGHIQAMLGHEKLEMVYRYAELDEEDILWAHRKYGPIDNLF